MKIRHRNRQERWPGTVPEGCIKAVFFLGPTLSAGLLVLGLWILFHAPFAAFCVILAAVVCFAEWLMAFQTALAEFIFCEEGVRVRYPLEKERFYPWEAFQQICVCYYSKATEMNGYPLICLVRNGEKQDHFGRWKTGSVFHYRNLLCLDYSEEQLREIQKVCPYEIPDLRGTGSYRL
jgi:hypothetical protein